MSEPGPSGSLFRNFVNVGVLTLFSRLFGFVRDVMMAVVLGTGPEADAFFAAFRFPNLFRRLFAEGAFNTAFVPMFSGALVQRGHDGAVELASRIMSWLVLVLFMVTVLGELFMAQVLAPFVPGFLADPAKFDLTVLLTRICFPYLALMSLMAAYAGILNGLGRFAAAATAPILLNLVMIGFLVPLIILAPALPAVTAIWVAVATLGGGVAQLLLVYAAIRRAGFVPPIRWPKLDKEVRRFWFLAVPAILAGGITQINIFIGTIIASGAESAISYLYYADRLYQLPLGIIGIAIGTVLLPELSRQVKTGNEGSARSAQDQSLLVSFLLSAPAAAGLIALALPIIVVLFERGAFTAAASQATAGALIGFAAGLPAFVLIRVLQPGFFAREDTFTPTVFAGLSVLINVGLSLLLFPSLQHVGIAIATSTSAWANALMLGFGLFRRGHLVVSGVQVRSYAAICGLSVVLGFLLWGAGAMANGLLTGAAGSIVQIGVLGAIIGGGLVLYFALLHLSGVQRFDQLMARFRRPLAGRTGDRR